MIKGKNYLFFLFFGLLLMFGAFLYNRVNSYTLDELALISGKRMEKKALRCREALLLLANPTAAVNYSALNQLYEEEKIAVYSYLSDSLVFWNNAQTPIEIEHQYLSKTEGFLQLKHGYYLYSKTQAGTQLNLALCLIKPKYEIQNKYLKNQFEKWTGIHEQVDMDPDNKGLHPVFLDHTKLFSISGNATLYNSEGLNDCCFLIFLIGILCLFFALVLRIHIGCSDRVTGIILGGLLVIRIGISYFKWPDFFYGSSLYDVREFGNAHSFVNAFLGDIVINAVLALFVALSLYIQFKPGESKQKKYLHRFILFLAVFALYYLLNQTLISLVTNSTLSFNFLSIFNVKTAAFIGIAALGVYSLALFLCMNKLFSFYKVHKVKEGMMLFAGVLLLGIAHQVFSGTENLLTNYWLLLTALGLFVLSYFRVSNFSYRLGVHVLISSFVVSLMLTDFIDKNLKSELDLLSLTLSERQDATLENEFASLPAKINSDERLNNLISLLPNTQKEIALLLKQKYFNAYFDRYTIEFSLFDKECHPLLSPHQPVYLNQGYFEDQITYYSDSTFVKDLYFVKAFKNNTRYIAWIRLREKSLFVLMDAKQVEELGSFPDLLLDQSQQKQDKLKALSYAVYRSGQVVNQFGEYNYPYFLVDSMVLFHSGSGYEHHYFRPETGTTVILSEKRTSFTEKFTFNSYLFLFFSVIGFVAYYTYSFIFNAFLKTSTLTQRIQSIIILLLLFAMTSVGITSSRLVSRQFENDDKKQLHAKTSAIINELLNQFSSQTLFDGSQQELINQKLSDYARLFTTDVSLFNNAGFLVNTSQPKLYEMGLASDLVNPEAYWKLKLNKTSTAGVIEKAGSLNYLSQYTPIYNEQKELAGFINLPYFARQSDLVNELSGIISALINVYVILFILSIITGLVLSGYITQPLRIIKQQISRISLGKQNEMIVWQSEDEIGKLVSEYNQMLLKLETSANLLAQSEREGAWREMAKQVAHEIKNPLTPMKLNLQYLQHLMKNHPDDFKEKFESASAGIIEQIDSLANIATEFSNFAKLPGAQLQRINLVEVLQSAIHLFDKQKQLRFTTTISESEIFVNGDKDQCLRVFNNVFKNAVQALEESENPEIRISAKKEDDRVIISVEDNGCGIAAELKPILFTPNFTTKTTGSGLGLAMVKNIMQGFGGKIWFESEKEKGATFFLEFVLSDKAENRPKNET